MDLDFVSRRQVLGAAGTLALSTLLPKTACAAPAYSFSHGEFEITVLSDGFISVPGEILVPDVSTEKRAAILSRIDAPGGVVRAKTNIPLLRKGNDLILVDIGAGHKYQPSDGGLADDLRNAGVDPSAITKVIFTHAHPDHIWATLTESGLRYPNATYHVGASEWDFWMDPDYLTNMPDALHDFAKGAQRDLNAIKDRVVMLKPGEDVVTGLTVLDTAGHTPGHLSFEVAGSDGLLITADVANNQIVSFEHPEWKFGYDTHPDIAIQNRLKLLDRAAADKVKLVGYHWEYPGVGFAACDRNAFRFVSAT
ncbi:MBL fold metallo-hydrolase [Mesorhizobium sp. dw_380]|uniref:MBL fold metallo-hydrolase n=1 Tax=Mesorhizobium sp. dw_380 TaxID=2812001 RepID=UPI001BDF5197|nr:MBL fold metallo-hydrolase [Mesorhizobium sp. dw_380]